MPCNVGQSLCSGGRLGLDENISELTLPSVLYTACLTATNRDLLDGLWGILDPEDCAEGTRQMVAKGLIDSKRVVIRGGASGQYNQVRFPLEGFSDLGLRRVWCSPIVYNVSGPICCRRIVLWCRRTQEASRTSAQGGFIFAPCTVWLFTTCTHSVSTPLLGTSPRWCTGRRSGDIQRSITFVQFGEYQDAAIGE